MEETMKVLVAIFAICLFTAISSNSGAELIKMSSNDQADGYINIDTIIRMGDNKVRSWFRFVYKDDSTFKDADILEEVDCKAASLQQIRLISTYKNRETLENNDIQAITYPHPNSVAYQKIRYLCGNNK